MTLAARFVVGLLALLALGGSAAGATRPVAGTGPQGLHPFLLRADERRADVFARTPSFAWKPVAGAIKYEFQLSTSSVFREGGVVYNAEATGPAISLPLTLPWITGTPYSLYSRVRAVLRRKITPWSRPVGFNMRWPNVPSSLPSQPGLVRWTPVEGAMGYQVWLTDVGKIISVRTNVLDERELYTFHQSSSWSGTARWRVRALRSDDGARLNGLPAASYGPWSPIYTSTNPQFATGPLRPLATISDIVADGGSTAAAHRLMPAFIFTGNQTLSGQAAELYRVYVFTDADCINRVYRGAIVGGPAYAPRPFGPLALPRTSTELSIARNKYLASGDEGGTFARDGESIKSSESDPAATPTTSLKSAPTAGSEPPKAGSGSGTGSTGSQDSVTFINIKGQVGAPVDLWDVDWPRGSYYWTVVGVEARPADPLTTSLTTPAAAGGSSVTVGDPTGFASGDVVTIGNTPTQDKVTITSITGSSLAVAPNLTFAHGAGESVVRPSGALEYRDLELAQEACASGRVLRFGKTSEPVLTNSRSPFASGLSPRGRLISASRPKPSFYGAPLVAWMPALGASVYEVQWSRTRYPFRVEPDPKTNALGILTVSTSTVLPLQPGTWYYRVRGINFQLPTGAQQMSWSAPAAVVVAKPRFRIVRG